MNEQQKNKILILASQSPRRIEILKNAGYFFVPFPVQVSEIPNENISLDEQIIDIARRKAQACLDQYPDLNIQSVIVSADTMVCIHNQALGKPENQQQAFDFLHTLSGKTHQVKTAMVLYNHENQNWLSHIETTEVTFLTLTNQEILDYIASGEPMDKAGAYAIQGLGKKFVKTIAGDYENVVGLPLAALKSIFLKNNWSIKMI